MLRVVAEALQDPTGSRSAHIRGTKPIDTSTGRRPLIDRRPFEQPTPAPPRSPGARRRRTTGRPPRMPSPRRIATVLRPLTRESVGASRTLKQKFG